SEGTRTIPHPRARLHSRAEALRRRVVDPALPEREQNPVGVLAEEAIHHHPLGCLREPLQRRRVAEQALRVVAQPEAHHGTATRLPASTCLNTSSSGWTRGRGRARARSDGGRGVVGPSGVGTPGGMPPMLGAGMVVAGMPGTGIWPAAAGISRV